MRQEKSEEAKTLERISQYVNIEQIKIIEEKSHQAEVFGELLGRSFDALFKAQPGADENYFNLRRKTKIGRPYLFRSSIYSDGRILPEHDLAIECNYNEELGGHKEVPLSLIDVKENRWYQAKGWDDAPEVLQRDVRNVLGNLGLKEEEPAVF